MRFLSSSRRVAARYTANTTCAVSLLDLSVSETKVGITACAHGNDLFQMTVNKIRNNFVNTT